MGGGLRVGHLKLGHRTPHHLLTSAAEFLKKEIDGESVVLKKAATDGDDGTAREPAITNQS